LDGDGRRGIADLSALRRLHKAEHVASIVKYLLREGGRNVTRNGGDGGRR
jgi:hypothetical protein